MRNRFELREESRYCKGYDFQTIKIQFETLDLLSVQREKTTNVGNAMFWHLTDIGKELMMKFMLSGLSVWE